MLSGLWALHGAHHGGPAWSIEEGITEPHERRGGSSWVELDDSTSGGQRERLLKDKTAS